MFCPNCGNEIPDDSLFCEECGTKLDDTEMQENNQNSSYVEGDSQDEGISDNGVQGNTIKILAVIAVIIIALVVGILFLKNRNVNGKETTDIQQASVEKSEDSVRPQADDKEEQGTPDIRKEDNIGDITETDQTINTTEGSKSEDKDESPWINKIGIPVEKPGDFSFVTMTNDKEKDLREMSVNASCQIVTTKDGVKDGYKTVTAYFTYDISDSRSEAGTLADGVFDSYTGTYFCEDYAHFPIEIEFGGQKYDITVEAILDVEYPTMSKAFIVTCPESYDGLVFFAGYYSLEMSRQFDKLNPKENIVKFDDANFDIVTHSYYFFKE